MPLVRQTARIPSRRRREDDGEEEESFPGDVEDDSVSEGSVISNCDDDADVEGSEVSGEDEEARPASKAKDGTAVATSPRIAQNGTAAKSALKPSIETEAMMNGLKISENSGPAQEMQLDEMVADGAPPAAAVGEAQQGPPKQDTTTDKNRLDHREYLRQRDTNPAFVPNRGGFFLHDDRSASNNSSNFRSIGRGRGRGFQQAGNQMSRYGYNQGPAEQPWAHDLHETVAKEQTAPSVKPANMPATTQINPGSRPANSLAPNRSFSVTTILGNVTVRLFLPGMEKGLSVPNVVRKHHTLLPQHRPPLRRDKPVRISIPEQSPRYIFPSTDRSFIFIPRAMRPNQQAFVRGRGRGSFHGSRRTSMFGGSTYSPSVAMSRKSSVGGATPRADLHSPAGSVLSRQAGPEMDAGKPVVRLPMQASLPLQLNTFGNGQQQIPTTVYANQAFARENQSGTLPMHQPRPQKTVSVADIESPASFSFNPPRQQLEQPFHQQVPTAVPAPPYSEDSVAFNPRSRRQSHATLQTGTPLSQIPETAIYAQPFQPFPMLPPAGYFAPPYPPGTVFYPPLNADGSFFNGSMASSVMAPSFVPAAQQSPFVLGAIPAVADDASPANTVAHESNGMVFYYDPSQMPPQPLNNIPQYTIPQPGGVVGMGGMMTPPAHFYYPQASNGMYFAPQ